MILRAGSLAVLLALAACSGEEFSGTGATGGGGGAAGSPAGGGAGGAEAQPTSCKSLLAGGVTNSGVNIVEPYAGQTLSVYCEMKVGGGGWTLVARSAKNPPTNESFGWKRQRGAVSDTSAPYSLDVFMAGIAFQEIMVAERGPGFEILRAFVASVPTDYLTAYASAPYQFNPPFDDVAGPCKPSAEVAMLTYGGHTDLPEQYAFRDHTDPEVFGLLADGWNMAAGSDCNYNGGLSWKQGMLFVR